MKKWILMVVLCAALSAACQSAPTAVEQAEAPAQANALPAAADTVTERTPCAHTSWENGVCLDCGMVCMHGSWADGLCVNCGMVCPHEAHDPVTVRCLRCGTPVRHCFIKGVCACTTPLTFENTALPEALQKPCARAGRVERVSYATKDYKNAARSGEAIEKSMTVYLPYGYDPSKQYNVLILMHGLYEDDGYWLTAPQTYNTGGGEPYTTATVLDNLIDSGYCDPLIAVAPTFYTDLTHPEDYDSKHDAKWFAPELREAILPYVIAHYATYATGTDAAEMAAARAHFGYVGLSMGGVIGFQSVLSQCLDLIGWVGCMSEFGADAEQVNAAMAADGFSDLPVYYLYTSSGELDSAARRLRLGWQAIVSGDDRLTDGENTAYVEIPGAEHEYRVWVIGLYNCLRVFFTGV